MARQKIGLSATFQTANQSQASVIEELEGRNEELEAEIARLKVTTTSDTGKVELEAKLQQLAASLEQSGGSQDVPLNEITRNPFQPRTIFPKDEILAFANILSEEGQHTPIILIPLAPETKDQLWEQVKLVLFSDLPTEADKRAAWANIRYFIFDGERRYRSQALLGATKIRAVLRSGAIDFLRIQGEALTTTLHRKDLHELNLATCLVQQILYTHPEIAGEDSPESTIPKILEAAINRLNYLDKAKELRAILNVSAEAQTAWLADADFKSKTERQILEVLLKFRLHPGSIDSNVFPTLKLPDDLKQLIQTTGLEISKLNELKKLSAERLQLSEAEAIDLRRQLGSVMVQEKLKLSEVKTLIEKALFEHGIQPKKKKTAADQIRGLKFDKLKLEEMNDVRSALEQKLVELQAMQPT